jgi:hypothetical protein
LTGRRCPSCKPEVQQQKTFGCPMSGMHSKKYQQIFSLLPQNF